MRQSSEGLVVARMSGEKSMVRGGRILLCCCCAVAVLCYADLCRAVPSCAELHNRRMVFEYEIDKAGDVNSGV